MSELNTIDWILRYTVGFYYKTPEWKEKMFNYIINQFSKEEIEYARKDRFESYIQIKNGAHIRFLRADGSSRGYKFNQIVYEPGVSDEIYDMFYYNTIARPIEVRIEEINDR